MDDDGQMFLTCPSICVCVYICMGSSLTGLLFTSLDFIMHAHYVGKKIISKEMINIFNSDISV